MTRPLPFIPCGGGSTRGQGRFDTARFSLHEERDGGGATYTAKAGYENIADGAAVHALPHQVQEEAKS